MLRRVKYFRSVEVSDRFNAGDSGDNILHHEQTAGRPV